MIGGGEGRWDGPKIDLSESTKFWCKNLNSKICDTLLKNTRIIPKNGNNTLTLGPSFRILEDLEVTNVHTYTSIN